MSCIPLGTFKLFGVIVGYKGSNVKYLERRYHISMYVPPKSSSNRTLEIKGLQQDAKACKQWINDTIRQVQMQNLRDDEDYYKDRANKFYKSHNS